MAQKLHIAMQPTSITRVQLDGDWSCITPRLHPWRQACSIFMTNQGFCIKHPLVSAHLDLSPCPTPAWLPDRQSQTLFGALLAPTNRIRFFRERVETPDGDFIDFDWNSPLLPRAPKQARDATLIQTAATDWLEDSGRQALGLAQSSGCDLGTLGSCRRWKPLVG